MAEQFAVTPEREQDGDLHPQCVAGRRRRFDAGPEPGNEAIKGIDPRCLPGRASRRGAKRQQARDDEPPHHVT
jgi:hypothetical protein